MWILVRGIRVDHGARACPQSHDDHVRRDCHYVRRDCNPSDPMWVARLHGGVARLRPSPLYVHRARVRHPHTSICHVPRSLHSPWGYEPPGIPHSRRQLCRGRFSATGTSSSRCAYPTARPVAIRPLCDNNDNKRKGNGSPGHGCTWELALPLLLARRHAELGQTAPPAARVGPIPASASSNDLPSERRGATPADARPWRCNTGSQTSQRTSANLEIEIHKPRRACRQTLPAEFTNLGLHLSEPSKSFFKPPLQCGRTQGFMLPNLCFFIAKPKVNV